MNPGGWPDVEEARSARGGRVWEGEPRGRAMPRNQLQTKSLGPRAGGRHRRGTHVKYGG